MALADLDGNGTLDLYVAIARKGKRIVGYKTRGLAQKVGEIE
jgi:hypothetical protein